MDVASFFRSRGRAVSSVSRSVPFQWRPPCQHPRSYAQRPGVVSRLREAAGIPKPKGILLPAPSNLLSKLKYWSAPPWVRQRRVGASRSRARKAPSCGIPQLHALLAEGFSRRICVLAGLRRKAGPFCGHEGARKWLHRRSFALKPGNASRRRDHRSIPTPRAALLPELSNSRSRPKPWSGTCRSAMSK